MNEPCIICDIVNKKLKSFIIDEDDLFIAFLDIRPLFFGHTLLAPKQHIVSLYGLPVSQGSPFLAATQKIGTAIKTAMKAEGTFIASNDTVSQSIPHLHLHIVPRNKGDGLKGFFWPRVKYEDEAHMQKIQLAIKNAINQGS